MSIRRINKFLPAAIQAIKDCGICNDKSEIDKTFRGQISSFGAAVQMGSLEAAVAFFSKQGGAATDRQKLMQAIGVLVYGLKPNDNNNKDSLLIGVLGDQGVKKAEIIDAAVAIKLAMNAYILIDSEEKKKRQNGKEPLNEGTEN